MEGAATGMEAAITAITNALSASNLWGEFATVAPFIGAIGLFAFGYMIVRKVVKGAAKGKLRA